MEVDVARLAESLLDRVLGDLGEGHAVGGLGVGSDGLGDVPRDGLTLAVEVGGQPQAGRGLERLPQPALPSDVRKRYALPSSLLLCF